MKKPSVTVILPGKDVGEFIGTTLRSLTTQFDRPEELRVIAIDDGSTDDTAARMRGFGEAFEHFELISNATPVGLAGARNQGLARVDTELFAFVDGDDWMQPRRLSALRDAMRSLKTDFVRTDHVTSQGRERVLRRAPFPLRGVAFSPREAILPVDQTTMVDYPYAWAGMFHRRLIDDGLAAFPEGLFTAEDRPWIWRLHLQSASFAVVEAPALLYRRGVTGSLTQIVDRRQLDFLRAFSETLRTVEDDRDAARFMPKIVATSLAVSAHHLSRAGSMHRDDRALLRSGVRELIATMPGDLVRDAVRTAPLARRRTLRRFIAKAGE